MDDQAARDLVARVESLLDDVDESALPAVTAIVELYGEGLARMMALADGTREALARDELVAHLLLLHDLHPVPVEERVRTALGDDADLVSVDGGVAVVRMKEGGCASCSGTAATKLASVEAAVLEAAPDVERVEDVCAPLMTLPQVSA
jgi:Fe-S cluster biogenesis protein NfuA